MARDTWKEHLKYPALLFFVLLLTKIVYIVVESQYNYNILDTLTQASLDTKSIDELNEFGHQISSVGLTLLLIPIFYFLFKRYKMVTMYLLISFSSIVSYMSIKHSLDVLIDSIVERNSDKRYQAYYTNIFKYGVLNGHFSYDSFISTEKISENELTVEDKVLIINTFLIIYADKTLIEKLLSRGSGKISELYLDMDKDSGYKKSYEDFKNFSSEITKLWARFGEERKKLSNQMNKLEVESNIEDAHRNMLTEVDKEYYVYKDATKDLDVKVREETQPIKRFEIERELKKYYKYKNSQIAQDRYKKAMNIKFGHYIEPDRWCNDFNCPSMQNIGSVRIYG